MPVVRELYRTLSFDASALQTARRLYFARQCGLYQVALWEKAAETFRKTEEAKWVSKGARRRAAGETKPKAKKDAKAEESVVAGEKNVKEEKLVAETVVKRAAADEAAKGQEGEANAEEDGELIEDEPAEEPAYVEGEAKILSGAEKQAAVEALLHKLKSIDHNSLLRDDLMEEMLHLAQSSAEEERETATRPGILGLASAYYAEDFGTFQFRRQLYDGVWGPQEEAAAKGETRQKLRGMLADCGLVPDPHSPLWQTTSEEAWSKWAKDGVEPAAPEDESNLGEWRDVEFDQAAKIIAGVISEEWAPGAVSKEHSDAEWNRRAAMTKKQQEKMRVDRKEFPIEWITNTYLEPQWTDKARRRWRERKVVLKVRLAALELPPVVKKRLVSLLGPRYNKELDEGKVVADKYDTKEENRLYSLMLFRSLLTESWLAHPNFVRVKETRKDLLKKTNTTLKNTISELAKGDKLTVFRFSFDLVKQNEKN